MDRKIILQSEMPISKWSGGTTTQLYIEPEKLTVKDDFNFRISTATVERGESNFTFFKGYRRLLIILVGELSINHGDGEFKILKPFEPYLFSGDIKTVSRSDGDIIDLNFIWKEELGECTLLKADSKEKVVSFLFNSKIFTYNFYHDKGWELVIR